MERIFFGSSQRGLSLGTFRKFADEYSEFAYTSKSRKTQIEFFVLF